MKIVESAGESTTPPLPRRIVAEVRPVLAVSGAGSALWAGSLILARRGWTLLGSHLDRWERLGVLSFTGYVIVYTANQHPDVTQFAAPGAAVAWCTAAWLVAPPAAALPNEQDTGQESPDKPHEGLTLGTLATVVRRVAGDRQGAHLADLLAEPELTGWEQSHLKAEITALGVPVEEFKLRLGGRQRVRDGVRLRDLPPPVAPDPAPAAAPTNPTNPTPHPEQGPTPEPG